MSKLVWDETGDRLYETGVRQGVLYPQGVSGTYPTGVAWNGLTAVTESPSGAEASPIYADDIKYLSLMSAEEFGATVEAYTYPDEFGACDGSAALTTGVMLGQQKRSPFGLCYRTTLGNDLLDNEYGYKLHIIYGAKAAPSEKAYGTVNDSPEAITFSWELTTTPVTVAGFKPTASLTIDSTKVDAAKLAALEAILYGDTEAARLPLPAEILTLMAGTPETGTAVSGTSTTIVLATGASAVDDFYNGKTITITSGVGSGQTKTISDYVGSTKTATVSVAWTTTPTSASVYSIV